MNSDKKFKRSAKLLDDGLIQLNVDAKTQVVRKVRDQDFEDWPDLEKPKAKRGRRKKVETHDAEGNTESSAE